MTHDTRQDIPEVPLPGGVRGGSKKTQGARSKADPRGSPPWRGQGWVKKDTRHKAQEARQIPEVPLLGGVRGG